MKSLKLVLEASLLDLDANLDVTNEEVVKSAITQFINDNYDCKKFTISKNPNKDGKYKVSSNDYVKVKNNNITSLTNDLFVWKDILFNFSCSDCNSLKSLEGSPKKVGGHFVCSNCGSLKSLEGAPEKVGGHFVCSNCGSLKSLEGAPDKIGGDFNCAYCSSLQSLEGAPNKVEGSFSCVNCDSLQSLKGAPENVKLRFYCYDCKSLKSLKGAPKEVGGIFNCEKCNLKFEESDVREVSNVKGKIYV